MSIRIPLTCLPATPISLSGLASLINQNEFESYSIMFTPLFFENKKFNLDSYEEKKNFISACIDDEGFIITDEKKTVITKKTQPFCFEISKLKYSLTSNLFISTDNSPFILILGKSTSSLSAFIFDGSFGV